MNLHCAVEYHERLSEWWAICGCGFWYDAASHERAVEVAAEHDRKMHQVIEVLP